MVRTGCLFPSYLDGNHIKKGTLSLYIAKIRKGNVENFKFLKDEERKIKFFLEKGIDESVFD